MTRLRGCLDNLPNGRRRVLELRAGVGPAPARSRRGVARKLDISVTRVRRLERGGLRQVRRLARQDACGGASGASATSAGDDGPVLAAAPAPSTGTGDGGASGGTGGANGSGGSGSGSGGSGDVRGESSIRIPPPALGGPRDAPDGASLWIAAALILLAGMAGYATPGVRDRLRGHSGASSPG